MADPFISIVIPVYNGENYLRGAIGSALAQTYGKCEVIVVNDGSTDGTEAICRSFGSHIRYFNKSNGGVSSALNLGIREMHSDYFTWLAHDDQFYPDKLELQIQALEQHTDKTVIVHGNYDLLNVKDNTISQMRQEDSYRIDQLTNSVFPLLMTTVHASTPLIHKSHFDRVGTFDESLPLTQDYDFLFRAMRNQRSVFVSQPLLLSRLHDQSGKNTNHRFGLACAEQYHHFADTLTDEEVGGMFVSPRAFYFRMAAMMRVRYHTPDSDQLLLKMKALPEESSNPVLADYIRNCSDGEQKKLCIFGAGYHGRILRYELNSRQIEAACFCDNNNRIHGTQIEGVPCVAPDDLVRQRDDVIILIAADGSDVIERQLRNLGFPYVTTKKKLDSYILETPPII